MTRRLVGIDLGTTYSLVSVLESGAPVLIPNALGEVLTPSAVSLLESGEIVVGAAARARAATHPTRTAVAFKRDMGTAKQYALGDRTFSPTELSALVLRSLKQDAEAHLGESVTEAVITVPAYFGEAQRAATRAAAELAGLSAARMINEPTAAALAYGLDRRDAELTAIVLDLGGGTFDVTVLELMKGIIEVKSSAGDGWLGGEDFTAALAQRLTDHVQATFGSGPSADPTTAARLLDAAEHSKRQVSTSGSASTTIPALRLADGRREDVAWTLTAEAAAECFAPICRRLEAPIQRALRDAALLPRGVDQVLLVGGATRMPCVAQMAARLFGKLPSRDLPPDEAVALGAAIQGGLMVNDVALGDVVATDIAPHTLGVACVAVRGSRMVEGVFSPILERGTVIPASRMTRVHTVSDGQTMVRVRVFQGEHSMCADNHLLGEYVLEGIPPGPAGQSVDLRFTYDPSGLLDVDMTVVATGKTSNLVIEPAGSRLTSAELAARRAAMARLKIHPRELLPNATAIARAEAAFVELTGVERERVGAALANFRTALEGQNPGEIELARTQLTALTASVRAGL